MTLTLILTRHAKSDWGDASLDDFDRPLNPRGRRSAPAVAKWLAESGFLPDTVVVSGARRTVETWSRMASTLPSGIQMTSAPALYHADARTILGVLAAQTLPSVMLIGHNPGFADFAQRIVGEPPDHPRFYDYPTCATTVVRFDLPAWSEVDWGKGAVAGFVVPRELL